jgi:hypothetical protein
MTSREDLFSGSAAFNEQFDTRDASIRKLAARRIGSAAPEPQS